MLQRIIKKIIPIICSLIIGFSSFSVCAAEPDSVIYSSSDITQLLSSSEFTVFSYSSQVSSNLASPCYQFSLKPKLTNLQFNFDFVLSSLNISKYRSYNFYIPFILYFSTTRFSINNFSIFLNIVYEDGSTSSFCISPSSISDVSSNSYGYEYYIPFNFSISGNKLLNIADCYFDIYYNSPSRGGCTCYLGIKNNDNFVVSYFIPDYNPLFNSSVNWVSDIFKMVSDNFSLVVLCIGFPVVAFSFLLLKRLIRS